MFSLAVVSLHKMFPFSAKRMLGDFIWLGHSVKVGIERRCNLVNLQGEYYILFKIFCISLFNVNYLLPLYRKIIIILNVKIGSALIS